MASRISPDLGDPVRTAWQIAWVGHAMLHDPLHLFNSNAFYPAPSEPRLLGLAARLRPGRLLRLGHRRGARPLQPALPVRLVARASSAPTCWHASSASASSARRGRGGVRLRPLQGHRGRPSACDLLRRHPAGAVPAAARLPALLAQARARRLAGGHLAGQPRLHAGPAVHAICWRSWRWSRSSTGGGRATPGAASRTPARKGAAGRGAGTRRRAGP